MIVGPAAPRQPLHAAFSLNQDDEQLEPMPVAQRASHQGELLECPWL
jgi:hypothetical protein